ncbi:MAG: hypothetical protein AAFO69_12420, partial [Bacteroidota bacterium]
MKRAIILILFVLTAHSSFGQESKRYLKFKNKVDYREGYVITNDSIKINGLLKDNLVNDFKSYSTINFIHQDGTKERFGPGGLIEFGYALTRFVSDHKTIYRLIKEGKKVSLYKNLYVSTDETQFEGTTSTVVTDFYVKKYDEKTFNLVDQWGFAKKFSYYFADCEDLSGKIASKEYKHDDIFEIVFLYNS